MGGGPQAGHRFCQGASSPCRVVLQLAFSRGYNQLEPVVMTRPGRTWDRSSGAARARRSRLPGDAAVVGGRGVAPAFGWQNVNWHEPHDAIQTTSPNRSTGVPELARRDWLQQGARATCCPMFQLSSCTIPHTRIGMAERSNRILFKSKTGAELVKQFLAK